MPAPLFTPFQLRGVTLKNRIVVSPMCQYSTPNGFANDWTFQHLATRAVGGAALVFTEATAITPEGRISPADLGIWDDAHADALRRSTEFIASHGAIAGIQLSHAGRKASVDTPWNGGKVIPSEHGGWHTVAPSAIPFRETNLSPHALTIDEIHTLTAAFRDAAHRAANVGFRVIELHAAHGYLIHQFLSPLSNQRTDAYGGSFTNRTRFLHETVRAVRDAIPDDLVLMIRISATDWADGGWDADQSVALAHTLTGLGVDLIDCSTGGLLPHVTIPVGPGYQVQFAERIRRDTGMPTGAVGMIVTPEHANAIVEDGSADIILLARELLRHPYWPLQAAGRLGADVPWPVQYERARD